LKKIQYYCFNGGKSCKNRRNFSAKRVSLSTQWRESGGRKCRSKRCSRSKVDVASVGASGAGSASGA